MKKSILLLIFFISSTFLRSQISNPGFENLNADGSIKYWGAMILLAVVLDTNGHPTDSLVRDSQFYFSSNDAHTGTKALEMRNAYWFNSGEKIGGRANLVSNDTNYFGFNAPVSFGQTATDFSFYYKFIPTGNDTAYAYLRLSDSTFMPVGEAEIFIHGIHNSYVKATAPIIYSGGKPSFLEIGFSTYKAGSPPNYGTRFVVDDVNLTLKGTGIASPLAENKQLSSYPNPATNELNLRLLKTDSKQIQVSVLDVNGRKVEDFSFRQESELLKIDVEKLPEGLYFINILHGGYSYTARLVK